MFRSTLFIIILALTVATSCNRQSGANSDSENEQTQQQESEQQKPMTQMEIDIQKIQEYAEANGIENLQSTESGLHYVISEQGDGPQATKGSMVNVHYKGTLLDGTKFDSSFDRGEPIGFQLGVGQVIQGWDEGIALFKQGGKGTLYIPSELGYGNRQVGPTIKPNSVLIFDIELVGVN